MGAICTTPITEDIILERKLEHLQAKALIEASMSGVVARFKIVTQGKPFPCKYIIRCEDESSYCKQSAAGMDDDPTE